MHNYVGVNVLVFTPDYEPTSAIELWIYPIHYEPRPQRETILFGLASSPIGTILTSAMFTTVPNENKGVE